jgi:hypothetical protein
MKMKVFLSDAAVLIALLGSAWLMAPDVMVGRWGARMDLVGLFMGRCYGVMLPGYGVILGLGRGAAPSTARTAILAGGAFATGLITLISLGSMLARTVSAGEWITVAVEALLAVGFLSFLVAERAASRGQTST